MASGKLVFANVGKEAKQRRVIEANNQKEMKRKREESIKVGTGRIKNNVEYFVPFNIF